MSWARVCHILLTKEQQNVRMDRERIFLSLQLLREGRNQEAEQAQLLCLHSSNYASMLVVVVEVAMVTRGVSSPLLSLT